MADGVADGGAARDMGGVEGPEAMYVKLIASDGHEFIMKREHALTSGTIKAMLSGPGDYKYIRLYIYTMVKNTVRRINTLFQIKPCRCVSSAFPNRPFHCYQWVYFG